MTTIALRVTPSPGSIIFNQARALVLNHKWELLFMGLVILIYHLSTLFTAASKAFLPEILPFQDGALTLPGQFILVLFGAFWAFRIWEGLHGNDRSTFLSYPAGRVTHQFLRITAGSMVFIAVIAFFWLLGATMSEIFFPGYSWFSAPEYNGIGWIVTLFGVLNAYLYATILALLFRKPELWFLVWIPVAVSSLGYIFMRTGSDLLMNVVAVIFSSPYGAMTGFGLQSQLFPPDWELPALGVLFMWTCIYTCGLYLVARIHRGG